MGTIQEKLTYLLRTQGLIRIAINNKGGNVTADTPFRHYAQAIIELPAGTAGELDIPVMTGQSPHRFANNNLNWLIKDYSGKITTQNLTNTDYLFNDSSELERIGFTINLSSSSQIVLRNCFGGCTKLTELPEVIANRTTAPSTYANLTAIFSNCYLIRQIDNDFFWKLGNETYWNGEKTLKGYRNRMFDGCYSLRKLPDISMLGTVQTSYSNNLYYQAFNNCYVLDEVVDLPISGVNLSSQSTFYYMFNKCYRLKRFTFETNADGSAKTATWKNGVLDLSTAGFIGNEQYVGSIINFNSGLTEENCIDYSFEPYAMLDDPNAWCISDMWSRYDKFSAIETINSLPDTSAYGTNTIKFKRTAGQGKVQGTPTQAESAEIDALSEEEIAVAAAKGWTVALA